MNNNLAQFLQLTILAIWNLFPNGTMLLATWFTYQWSELVTPGEEEDDFWFPLYQ